MTTQFADVLHGAIIAIIRNYLCWNPIIALIIVNYCDYWMDYCLDYYMDYCILLWLFWLLRWIIRIIAFGLYGLFVSDNFKTAFPPPSLHGISSLTFQALISLTRTASPLKLERSCQLFALTLQVFLTSTATSGASADHQKSPWAGCQMCYVNSWALGWSRDVLSGLKTQIWAIFVLKKDVDFCEYWEYWSVLRFLNYCQDYLDYCFEYSDCRFFDHLDYCFWIIWIVCIIVIVVIIGSQFKIWIDLILKKMLFWHWFFGYLETVGRQQCS